MTLQEQSIDQYVSEIKRYPLLTREQELECAQLYKQAGLLSAGHLLVKSNLRFVVKIAHSYKGYGFPLSDLIQEGNVGLLVALQKFNPERGFRFISYAVWWIRAHIQNYVMKSWSLVKLGTTQAQRKLFFKLRFEREKADRAIEGVATNKAIAENCEVPEVDVDNMEVRLAFRDFSLDSELKNDDDAQTHLECLAGGFENQEQRVSSSEQYELLHKVIKDAMQKLSVRERYIVNNRLLSESPETLQEISVSFGVSRERVRQLECIVLKKLRTALLPEFRHCEVQCV